MKDPSSISSARLLTLHQVGRKINTQLDPDRLLDEIMDLAIGLLEADKGLILWRDSAGEVPGQPDQSGVHECVGKRLPVDRWKTSNPK